jgi:hypothetical protein
MLQQHICFNTCRSKHGHQSRTDAGWPGSVARAWGAFILPRLPPEPAPKQLFSPAKPGILMARPRLPASVLKLRGAFKINPGRFEDRKSEPIVITPLPNPPTRLPMPAKAAWLEMKYQGHWLTSADRFLVEIAASFVARYRSDELTSGDVSLLIGLLGKIGFSPNERGRMNLPTETT